MYNVLDSVTRVMLVPIIIVFALSMNGQLTSTVDNLVAAKAAWAALDNTFKAAK